MAATAEAVRQGHDSLAALLVEAVRGDVVAAGHAAEPFLRKTSALSRVSRLHFRPPEGMLDLRSAKDLREVDATGLEPVTPSVSSNSLSLATADTKGLAASGADRCTASCTSEPKPEQTDPLAPLAAALLGLSPADRARLAAMLLGQQTGQAEG